VTWAIDYSGGYPVAERAGGNAAIEEAWTDARMRRENGVAEGYGREPLGRALGMIPSGIFVVTTARDSVRAAYVGSWIQQAAFEPPSITIAMNQHRPLLTLLEPGRGIAVNILGRRQAPLYASFERGFSLDEDPLIIRSFSRRCWQERCNNRVSR
jgi:hypothetical protein